MIMQTNHLKLLINTIKENEIFKKIHQYAIALRKIKSTSESKEDISNERLEKRKISD